MKLIPLTQGQFAQVDDEDFDRLNTKKWQAHRRFNSGTYYAMSNIKVCKNKWKSIKMHRVILGMTDSTILVDHKDFNGLNNQKSNLRIATRSQNAANRKPKPNCTSKFLGVSFHKARYKWRASIQKDKKITSLGYFVSEIDAAKAYNEAAILIHGEFANLNHLG